MSYRTTTACLAAVFLSWLVVTTADAAITLSNSLNNAVFQRDAYDIAQVPLSGTYSGTITHIEARAVTNDGYYGTATDWTVIDSSPSGGTYNSSMAVPAGWYNVEIRAMNGATEAGTDTASSVGVGEVFIMAGQSNSANYGSVTQTPSDPRVSCPNATYSGWQFAADPQPLATGSSGSPWPDFGSLLVAHQQVPVGMISVGVGATYVHQWVPGTGTYYPRIQNAIASTGVNGFRAILWHQGESDTIAPGTPAETYASRLNSIIAQSRIDAGFDVPWGVARASWLLSTSGTGTQEEVIAGQNLVIDNDPLVFGGPNTDTFHSTGLTIQPDGTHFNDAGLMEHGRLWKEAVVDFFGMTENPWVPPPGPTAAVEIQSGTHAASDPYSLGWRFTPTETMVITKLGLIDAAGDGVNNIVGGGQPVSLFEWGGTDPGEGTCLVATSVPTGASPEMAGNYMAYYVDIEPITLEVGKEYFVAAEALGQDFFYNATLANDDGRPFDRAACLGRATPTGYPDMPSLANDSTFSIPGGDDDYFGGTFKYFVVVPGDANADGVVDETDAATLAENWGQSNATWLMGDFDEDGVVGPADAAIMGANWGYGTPEGQSVPEPTTLVGLIALGLLCLAGRFRR